ncbi:hypothetical protein Q4519_20660 [Motilimonas sp. 1_MG-2023]|uniref:hypothetical protein n=1 Tax=Motilimonas sp. 1_MG-2023 TaxID=3062672 RepID=UPI0026E46415|nr:hypothetical protein [Motilimonas sp. 1_MG-2023]MDO6528089.1 hypothetical protein [Motilimonas sp. 1_MG-2023]
MNHLTKQVTRLKQLGFDVISSRMGFRQPVIEVACMPEFVSMPPHTQGITEYFNGQSRVVYPAQFKGCLVLLCQPMQNRQHPTEIS